MNSKREVPKSTIVSRLSTMAFHPGAIGCSLNLLNINFSIGTQSK